MFWTSISANRIFSRIKGGAYRCCRLLVLLGVISFSLSGAAADELVVVYPKADQEITAVDSTFIFGHIARENPEQEYTLWINGERVEVHEGGGFLAFLPIESGDFAFRLRAVPKSHDNAQELSGEILKVDHPVVVPTPMRTVPRDSVAIVEEIEPPSGDLVIGSGDWLRVSFRGTPGCRAWFSLPGVVNLVPMVEGPARTQPYWGEAVFGSGKIPESLLVKGIYSGYVEIPPRVQVDTQAVQYFLAPPDPATIIADYVLPPYDSLDQRMLLLIDVEGTAGVTSMESSFRVTVNHADYPMTVRFTDSVQTMRHGPRKGYLSIFQPDGVEALATGAEGDWYRVQLSAIQEGWVHKESVKPLPHGIAPPTSYLSVVRTRNQGRRVQVEFALAGKHPFRVEEESRRTLRVQLFGVTTNTDWIRYDFSDEMIDLATWSQPEPGLYEFVLRLNDDLWGYDTYYEGNKLILELIRAPEDVDDMDEKTIVIDPGHSGDPGAIGPTGYTEAEANLAIALQLKEELEDDGARVILTREDTSDVPLYDRPAIARQHAADMFISVHNNALPDGVNPFENNGSATFYYHPHSIDLARTIQTELLEATGLPDYGLYHGNLAVNRPTQYPAVLVECAFMMIPEQEALLKTGEFREEIAEAIKEGIEQFLEDYENANR